MWACSGAHYIEFFSCMMLVLFANLAASFGAFMLCSRLIVGMKDMFTRAGMFGRDLNKTSTDKVPEGLGVVTGAVYLITLFLFIPVPFINSFLQHESFTFDHGEFTMFICALLSICCMIFLGFADDVLELRWRHKLFLPTVASLPLLMVYLVGGGATSVLTPTPLQFLLPPVLNLGPLYYVYMGMLAVFCSNAINILAGINGVEAGQSLVIGISIAAFNCIQLSRVMVVQQHYFSLYLILPFIGVTAALLRYNWYPSRVFVGDTFCYFAGMTFAVVGILGAFSKTMLLFFIPQILNFLYSTPQLFGLIPCPRHRLPKFNKSTGLLGMSYSQFKRSSLGPLGSVFLKFMRVFGMVAVEEEVGEDKNEIRVNNLTLINFVLKFIGPTHEQTLTVYMMVIQVFGTLFAFTVRYGLASFIYERVL